MKRVYKIPISAKGIIFEDNSVWLRKNERNEWELPGGKVGKREQPTQTVTRELQEELGFSVNVLKVIHAWMYTIQESKDESNGVLIVSYLCKLVSKKGKFEKEGEAGTAEFKKFPLGKIKNLKMPQFYKEAILMAWNDYSQSRKVKS